MRLDGVKRVSGVVHPGWSAINELFLDVIQAGSRPQFLPQQFEAEPAILGFREIPLRPCKSG